MSLKIKVTPAKVIDQYPKLAELFDVGARFVVRRKAEKKGNKYNPQSANRSGEAARRLAVKARREAKSIKAAQNLELNTQPYNPVE